MEVWDPKPPGTLWATPGLLRDSFTFFITLYNFWFIKEFGVRGFCERLPTFHRRRDSVVRYRTNTGCSKGKTIEVSKPNKAKLFFSSSKFPELLDPTSLLIQ